MKLSGTKILIIVVGVLLASAAIVVPTTLVVVNNHSITVTLLDNAGVMIDAKGTRIFIDPYNLPWNYEEGTADAILITHEHGDHYQPSIIDMLSKEETLHVFPTIMTSIVSSTFEDALFVEPLDTLTIADTISVTCFYMYTVPPEGYESSHPRESNYTSYLIDIGGFTIFHAGDSYVLDEYMQIADMINVAMLPLGPGCQTMCDMDVVTAIEVLNPSYFIPIHYTEGADEQFITVFGEAVENCGCEIVHLAYYESTKFKF